MHEIYCHGTPYETGFQHGQAAESEIARGIHFYKQLFLETNKLSWEQVCDIAQKFSQPLAKKWPEYNDEIQGVADGAGLPFTSILALNVRTEIAFGMFSDGCTALSWKDADMNILAQNWDWQQEQSANLIRLRIQQVGKPNIDMITEAGIIGKIGLNSSGVGVCLNAIRAKGVDFDRLPCHLALRRCLDSHSRAEAVAALQSSGVGSSCHILVADSTGGVGLECSSVDIALIPMSEKGVVIHTNHFLGEHPGVKEDVQLKDSKARLERIQQLVEGSKPIPNSIVRMLEDEDGFPTSINRQRTDDSSIATLFSIVMDLAGTSASVRIGRPSTAKDELLLEPHLFGLT
ncbi:MAG: hypothetical protein Q9222_002912 [Ikaeria aurantiellina]